MRNHRSITLILGFLLTASVSACAGSRTSTPGTSISAPPIAFIQDTNDVYLLYSNSTSHYVTTGQGVSWAPGYRDLLVQKVVYSNPPSAEIWLVSTNGQPIRQVTSVYPDQVRFFAAGKYGSTPFIAYDTLKKGIQLRNLLTGARRTIAANVTVDSLAISPDGTRIAFVEDPLQNSVPITLYVTGTYKQSPLKAVLPASEYRTISDPTWSPDGQWLAATITVIKGAAEPLVTAVWLMHPDGTDLHMLTMGSDPQWSPDGQWISYIGESGVSDALFKIHPDGTGRIQLTPYAASGADQASQPSW